MTTWVGVHWESAVLIFKSFNAFILLSPLFLLYACGESNQSTTEPTVSDTSESILESRPVATTYRTIQRSQCYQAPDRQSDLITSLSANRLVDLVSINNATMRANGRFWLHVYPRLSHRPSCYIEARNLVPVE